MSVERALYHNINAPTFPFDFVRITWGPLLLSFLRPLETTPQSEPLPDFVTAINLVHVWAGVRTAALPDWRTCSPLVRRFLEFLNAISSNLPQHLPPVPQVVPLLRRQQYRSGETGTNTLLTRLKNIRV
jgi:hypothetical protein